MQATENVPSSSPSNEELNKQLVRVAWEKFVFYKEIRCESSFGKLSTFFNTLGSFVIDYTADLGDCEAESAKSEDDESELEEEKESTITNKNNDEAAVTQPVDKKRKVESTKMSKKQRKELEMDENYRIQKDQEWYKTFVTRKGPIIYQIPHLQIQTVSTAGLTQCRKAIFGEFQKAAKLFGYQEPIWSGSSPHILEDLVAPRYNQESCIPHGLSKKLIPFVWEHYKPSKPEALCTSWSYLPSNLFNLIPIGNAPGETFHGKLSQTLHKKLSLVPDWREKFALATVQSYDDNFDLKQIIVSLGHTGVHLLKSTYPLQLVYVNDLGFLSEAYNLELCRHELIKMDRKNVRLPKKVAQDNIGKLDVHNPSLDILTKMKDEPGFSKWINFFAAKPEDTVDEKTEDTSTQSYYESFRVKCNLCPPVKTIHIDRRNFKTWKDYVAAKFEHAITHGPLGANAAYEHVPDWIDHFFDGFTDNDPIRNALVQAGFTHCGKKEQGLFQKFPYNGLWVLKCKE